MADLQSLKEQYGESIVDQAFALQAHIKENGLEGTQFISTARSKTQSRKWVVTKRELESNIPKRP
jgi:hypothetical protein